MIRSYKLKEWLNWPLVRAHLCTLAIGMNFNGSWRAPRAAHLYGALPYGVLVTALLVAVALPATLLQLAVGQLSQQDAVGVWRAVPFFRGVGYTRLLVSLLGSAFSSIYLALSIAYLLYAAANHIPFADCVDWIVTEEETFNAMNASECLSNTFMSPVSKNPQYYLATALIIIVLWIIGPFVFYNPIKLMKRIMYVSAPLVLILAIVIVSCIGDGSSLESFSVSQWPAFVEPHLWISATVQALWSNQVAGGYLISAGDSVYAGANVQWASLAITSMNIASTWFWLLFWSATGAAGVRDTGVAAALVQAYQAADERGLPLAWPLLVFLTLIVSGIISVLVLLYPILDRIRRVGGAKWRAASFAGAAAGAGLSLAVLAGGLPVITLLEDVALPLLICVATILEILAFGFLYGWRNLMDDVEFLIGSELVKYWVWGWWLAPGIISPLMAWWLAVVFIEDVGWVYQSWQGATALATAAAASLVFALCAAIAVGRQVQYDICGKLKSSFQPTRQWGPRDPITHYYWLARRDDVGRGHAPHTRYNRRELGQLSGRPSFLTTESTPSKDDIFTTEVKVRSYSYDWIYTTTHRKDHLTDGNSYVTDRKRSKSLDCDLPIRSLKLNRKSNVENNNNSIVVCIDK